MNLKAILNRVHEDTNIIRRGMTGRMFAQQVSQHRWPVHRTKQHHRHGMEINLSNQSAMRRSVEPTGQRSNIQKWRWLIMLMHQLTELGMTPSQHRHSSSHFHKENSNVGQQFRQLDFQWPLVRSGAELRY